MYYITYNDVITPHPYATRADAIAALQETFGDTTLITDNVMYWPDISARGHTKIEIKQYDGEVE